MAKQFQDVETDHEYDGIKEFDNPLPRWWLATFAITVLIAVVYWFGLHTLEAPGTFQVHAADMDEYNNQMLASAVSEDELIALAKDPGQVEAGKATYKVSCAPCHGDEGEGKIGPNLTDTFWIKGGGPKDIWLTVTVGSTAAGMPAWRPVLGDARVREVTAYLMSIQNTNVKGGKAPQGDAWTGK